MKPKSHCSVTILFKSPFFFIKIEKNFLNETTGTSVEKKSPVAQRKRGKQNGNWVLGDAHGLGPWTAAREGKGPPPPRPRNLLLQLHLCQKDCEMEPQISNGVKRSYLLMGDGERSFQKGMGLIWNGNAEIPGGSNPCGSWTPTL